MSLNKFTDSTFKPFLNIHANQMICPNGLKLGLDQEHVFKPPIIQNQTNNNNFLVYNHDTLSTEWRPINNLEITNITIDDNNIIEYNTDSNYNYYIDIINPNQIINIILGDEFNISTILNFIIRINNNLSFTINFKHNNEVIYTKIINTSLEKYYNLLFLKGNTSYILY